MMPLDLDGYGSHLLDLCREAQDFHRRVEQRNSRLAQQGKTFRLLAVAEPETNIVCLLAFPVAARGLAEVDEINSRAALRFGVRELASVQGYDYLVSKTRLAAESAFLASHPLLAPLERDAPSLTCLRLVFMNRWVTGETADGTSYMASFLDTLEAFLDRELRETD